jgi:hypothetical protein
MVLRYVTCTHACMAWKHRVQAPGITMISECLGLRWLCNSPCDLPKACGLNVGVMYTKYACLDGRNRSNHQSEVTGKSSGQATVRHTRVEEAGSSTSDSPLSPHVMQLYMRMSSQY